MLPSPAFNLPLGGGTQGNTPPGKAKKSRVAISYKPNPPELRMVAVLGMGKLRHRGIVLWVQVFNGAVGAEPGAKRVQSPPRLQLWS